MIFSKAVKAMNLISFIQVMNSSVVAKNASGYYPNTKTLLGCFEMLMAHQKQKLRSDDWQEVRIFHWDT